MNILTFDHFLNESLFTNVKKEFLQGDMRYSHLISGGESFEVEMNTDKITVIVEKVTKIEKVQNGDEVDEVYLTEPSENEIQFYSDFLLPKISRFENTYKKAFVRNLHKRNLFSMEAIKGYSQLHLNKLNRVQADIAKATHLIEEVKSSLLDVVASIYEYVSNGYYQKNMAIPKKIPFTLNKNQVVTLFHLLWASELISESEIKQTDLHRLIEETSLYYDRKTNSFKGITKSQKLCLELFGKSSTKSPDQILNDLKEIFTDSRFYDV